MTTLQVGVRFPHFYLIVFQGLRLQASTRNQIRCVFKCFHSRERFQKFAAGSVTKCLRIQTNPDTCGQGLRLHGDKSAASCQQA